LKGNRYSYPPQPKKGGVIEKIRRLYFDLHPLRHHDRRIIIRFKRQIIQQTGSN
jgi:hypothetical protein